MRERKKTMGLAASAAAAALVLAGCGDSGDDEPSGNADGALAGQEITIGVFEGWDEGVVASYLMGHVFEQEGATVHYEYGEAGPVYTAVAGGDYDVNFDAWLPNTHADYWAQLELEDLGTWYDDAVLSIAVNEDSPAQSLAELGQYADEYGGQVVGIDPGSGLNRLTRDEVFPTYGLEDSGFTFLESSTPAMLAELEAAIEAGENIAVALWHPHWAYAAFPIRDLADPENALAGGAEHIVAFGRPGFTEDFPQIAEWIGNFHLTSEQVTELEDIFVIQGDRQDPEGSVQEWLDANPDWIDQLKAGELK